MTDYTKLKVSELKELLKERDLPLSGTKSELVSRLEADDNAKGDTATGEVVSGNTAEPIVEASPAGDSTNPVEDHTKEPQTTEETSNSGAEVVGEKSQAESAEPEMSQAEAQQRVIEELEQRLKRHKRFATDPTDTELRLKRIRQFGLADINEAKRLVTFKPVHTKRRLKGRGKKVSA